MEKTTTANAGQAWRVRGDLKDDRVFLGGKIHRKGAVVAFAPGQIVPLELVELVQHEPEAKAEANSDPKPEAKTEPEALTASSLAKLKKEELLALAKDKGLAWDEKMTKDALVQLILAGTPDPKPEAKTEPEAKAEA